jgi:catechol 2,3-dioxygenase-like lactoylglutathione lyase family enzyme
MQIVAIDHVQLAMPAGQEEQARAFYAGVLGLAEVAKPAPLAGRGGCWFAGPGTALHLGVEDDFRPARKAHPALRVADLETARHELAAAGVPIITDDTMPQVRRLYVADPFGNRIELIQEGDRFA